MTLLSDADIVHSNSGSVVVGSNFPVALAGADVAAEGNTILIFAVCAVGLLKLPDGFHDDVTGSGGFDLRVFRRGDVGPGESSWTVPTLANVTAPWVVLELGPRVGTAGAYDQKAGSIDTTTGTTSRSTGTTPTTTAQATIALAVHGLMTTAGSPASSVISGHTGGFVELFQVMANSGGGTPNEQRLSVSWAASDAAGTYESTASFSAVTTQYSGAAVVCYPAAATVLEVPADVMTGG